MERNRRLILFLAATALTAALFSKGHLPFHHNGNVAFLPYTSSGVTVRVNGVVQVPGVHTLPDGATVAHVMKLTVPAMAAGREEMPVLGTRLRSGDVVEVTGEIARHPAISLKRMKAGEQMLLGIPLDPDRMGVEDWESLPGIGAVMARNIVDDRQDNGDYCSVEAVQRVPGMGKKKVEMIRDFFR